ncbi:MAG TPA: FUSC family protein [Candidatus Binatia bacterium]
MSEPAARRPSLLTFLRAELPPDPERWREALVVGLACTVALGASATLQLMSFAAPVFALLALQRSTVCTWSNFVRRAALCIVAGVVAISIGGLLVQIPWLLLPIFFLAIALLTYGVPMTRQPLEAASIAFPLIGACFTGTYDPASITTSTGTLVCAELIGVFVATAFAQASRQLSARRRLGASLAASYERSRARLAQSLERYLAAAPPPTGEAQVDSAFGMHVQLLDLARQEGLSAATDRLFATLTTAAERVATYVGAVDTLSREDVGRRCRALLEPELRPLAAAIDAALVRFIAAAHHMSEHDAIDERAAAVPWPDLDGLVATLRARQLELRREGAFAGVDVAEGMNVNAVVQSLVQLADVLHTPPGELHRFAVEEQIEEPPTWPWSLLPIDRFALRFALQVALGATIAFVVGVASHVPELSTLLWNPVLVAQSSYGATIRKAWLRLLGVIVGGALAIVTIVAVLANSNDVAVWLAIVLLVTTCFQHAVLARPTYWYGPLQALVTYFFVLVGIGPELHVEAPLWRAFGTFVGTAILFTVFRLIAPDYAGRQLVARLADLLRMTLVYLPKPGVPLAPLDELIAARLAVGRHADDLLRLTDEARLEGRASGIEPGAAVSAVGIALRVSLRAGLVARGRATIAWPPLPDAGRDVLERLHEAVRQRIALALEMLEARDTAAPPGTRAFDAACARARELDRRMRPDVERALADAVAYLDAARTRELADWSAEALAQLFAEVEHFRRIIELLPRLDTALAELLVPETQRGTDDATSGALVPDGLTRP